MLYTTKEHLAHIIRAIQQAMKDALEAGRFQAANELRSELDWLSAQLAHRRYYA